MITGSIPKLWNEGLLDIHTNLAFIPHGDVLKTNGVTVKSWENFLKWYLYKP
jgi:hypothetical protein